jgi:hypothetical protein
MTAGAAIKQPRKIFLHIGSDKAGSTALQTHLAANRQLLLRHGVYLPRIGKAGALGHHGLFFLNFTPANAQELVEEIDAQPADASVLMSWEGIHVLDEAVLSRFASLFPDCQFHIIYYVREQADLIQTGFLQQIKTQERRGAELFKKIDISPINRDFYRNVKKFERCFPGCELDVVLYDRAGFPRKNIVYHFFSILDGDLNPDDIAIFDSEINPSLGVDEVRILADIEEQYREINTAGNAGKRSRLVELLLAARGARDAQRSAYFLSETQVQACRKQFRRSNKALIAEYGVSEKLIQASKPVWNGEQQQSTRGRSITPQEQTELLALADFSYMNLAFSKRYNVPLSALLDEGWTLDEPSGQWLSGPRCSLRGAISLECYTPPKRFLRFALAGEYVAGVEACSTVSVNGKTIGDFDLTASAFQYPLEHLEYPYIIELDIQHKAAEDESGSAATPLAYYQLQRFQCTAVVVPDPPGRPAFP